MGYSVRPATQKDAVYLAYNLRREDEDEIFAASRCTPLVALTRGLEGGPAWVAVDSEGPIGVFGVCHSSEPQTGIVWMLATPRLVLHQRQFLRDCSGAVAELHRLYPKLTNAVDARNHVHIKWLAWCGFEFIRIIPNVGHLGLPFYQFERTMPVV